MRTAITLARAHGEKKWTLLRGPEVPIHEQVAAFKKSQGEKVNDKFAETELWDSSGGYRKWASFITQKQADAEAKAAKEAQEKADKAKIDAEKAAAKTAVKAA